MQFVVTGSGFDSIPYDAVAVIGTQGYPLNQRYTNDPWAVMHIVSKSDESIEFSASVSYNFSSPHILGAILSEDRQIIYWVNE